MNQPNIIFSIITVVYNGEALLEGTIQSVLDQTYSDIEYIVVDGNSKDGTIDIIKKYDTKISKWISEPDKGLYDAMNKGIKMATGDFLLFLNTGDRLFDKNTLQRVADAYTTDTDVLYGEVMLVNDARAHLGTRSRLTTQRLPKNLHWKSLQMGMVVCHQGFFARRQITPLYIDNNLCADIDWVINILKKSRKNTHTRTLISEYLVGGLSKQRHQQSLKNRFNILKKHYGFIPTLLAHIGIIIRSIFFKMIGKTKY